MPKPAGDGEKKPFSSWLKDLTGRDHALLEAYQEAVDAYLSGRPDDGQQWPLEALRAHTPVKEPLSAVCPVMSDAPNHFVSIPSYLAGVSRKVLVIKIGET